MEKRNLRALYLVECIVYEDDTCKIRIPCLDMENEYNDIAEAMTYARRLLREKITEAITNNAEIPTDPENIDEEYFYYGEDGMVFTLDVDTNIDEDVESYMSTSPNVDVDTFKGFLSSYTQNPNVDNELMSKITSFINSI